MGSVTTFACWDDAAARRFEPFALTRPVSELRAGALLVRERWQRVLGGDAAGFVGAPHLDAFDEPWAPGALAAVPAGTTLVHGRFAPALAKAPAAAAWRHDGRIVAVTLARDVSAEALRADGVTLESLVPAGAAVADLDGWWLSAPWDLVRHLPAMLAADVPALAKALKAKPMGGSAVRGEHRVFVEEGPTR